MTSEAPPPPRSLTPLVWWLGLNLAATLAMVVLAAVGGDWLRVVAWFTASVSAWGWLHAARCWQWWCARSQWWADQAVGRGEP